MLVSVAIAATLAGLLAVAAMGGSIGATSGAVVSMFGGVAGKKTYDESKCTGETSADTSDIDTSGNNGLERTFNALTSVGFSDEVAAGIAGNIKSESGGDPTKAEYGYSFKKTAGWGLIQWTDTSGSPRHTKVSDYVKQNLGDKFYVSQYSSPPAKEVLSDEEKEKLRALQVKYLVEELQASYSATYKRLQASTTVAAATKIFLYEVEIPRNKESKLAARTTDAEAIYDAYSGSGKTSTNTDSSSDESSSDNCTAEDSDNSDGDVPTYVGDIAMPMTKMVAGSNYGLRKHPITGVMRFHYGTDYPVPSGTPVFAIADGKVARAGNLGTCGTSIDIYHEINGSKIATRYCHLSVALVSTGDTVTKGQKVALSGNTGGSTGPHLHFEVRTSWAFSDDYRTAGNSVNSDQWLKAQGS